MKLRVEGGDKLRLFCSKQFVSMATINAPGSRGDRCLVPSAPVRTLNIPDSFETDSSVEIHANTVSTSGSGDNNDRRRSHGLAERNRDSYRARGVGYLVPAPLPEQPHTTVQTICPVL